MKRKQRIHHLMSSNIVVIFTVRNLNLTFSSSDFFLCVICVNTICQNKRNKKIVQSLKKALLQNSIPSDIRLNYKPLLEVGGIASGDPGYLGLLPRNYRTITCSMAVSQVIIYDINWRVSPINKHTKNLRIFVNLADKYILNKRHLTTN